MLNDEDKLICDNCEEVVGEGEVYFIDGPKKGGDFCSWECIIEFGSEMVDSNN